MSNEINKEQIEKLLDSCLELIETRDIIKILKNIKETDLKNIIHDIFDSYNLTNNDIFCNDGIKHINELVYITYCSIYNINIHSTSNNNGTSELFKYKFKRIIEDTIIDRIKVDCPNYIKKDRDAIIKHLDFLDTIPLPPQRTPEWYKFRSIRLTASDFATAVNKNPYSDRNKLIMKKCGHDTPFKAGPAIIHGVKYEDVAIYIYERRNNVSISEYGCMPHPTIDFLGASPDGICNKKSKNWNYIGRMLEIKCPKSRKLNGFPPEYYALQVQGQLEVCKLEYCDYLECVIREYGSKVDFFEDWDTEKDNHNYRKNGLEKGVLIELYNLKQNKTIYRYSSYDICISRTEIEKWEDNIIDEILANDNYEYISTTYWKLEEYSCILIKRDRELWADLYKSLEAFWLDVLYYRKHGIECFLSKTKVGKKQYNYNKDYSKKNDKIQFLNDSD